MLLYSRAATSILGVSKNLARRAKSTSTSAASSEEAASGNLAVAVATTFGTYMLADFLSNFIQHPIQKASLRK
ncbi:hypothetical protein ACHAWU_006689 [Discostella pseudostelligera]|uniref:Uncharacterized protein n=1 Tax=Discostella pseudostelligera TaxID=259834 RepID=A0ABD3M1C8_9STRA